MMLPPLFAKAAKKGEFLQWRVWSLGPVVFMEYGKLGGKLQTSKYVAKPTNEGRANYRDPTAQAAFEAQSAYEKKIKEGYYPDIEVAKNSELVLPMLAHRYDKQGHKFKFPGSLQYKLNGLRCLAVCNDNGVRLISRGNETWNIPHIQLECERTMRPGDHIDGEIYIHGVPLQTINSLAKRNRPESAKLQFHLYDMPMWGGQTGEWIDRATALCNFYQDRVAAGSLPYVRHELGATVPGSPIVLANTFTVHTLDEAKQMEIGAIRAGYEGVILRNRGGGYKYNYRSYDVFKLKNFIDAEFFILDMTQRTYVNPATGEETPIVDCVVCRNNQNDLTFEVVPRGSIEMKADYIRNKAKYIGTKLIVRFLEYSNDGLPQGNPVGLGFRIDEDIDKENENDLFSE
jgi:DNA ligase 1